MGDLSELHRTVGRIEGKLDTFIAQMGTQDTRTTDLEVRTRKLEGRQHWYTGVAAAVGAFIAYFTKAHG